MELQSLFAQYIFVLLFIRKKIFVQIITMLSILFQRSALILSCKIYTGVWLVIAVQEAV